jgi:hypothetical protein
MVRVVFLVPRSVRLVLDEDLMMRSFIPPTKFGHFFAETGELIANAQDEVLGFGGVVVTEESVF